MKHFTVVFFWGGEENFGSFLWGGLCTASFSRVCFIQNSQGLKRDTQDLGATAAKAMFEAKLFSFFFFACDSVTFFLAAEGGSGEKIFFDGGL